MLKNLKKRSQGFTIIEVLIVLAIAGLILLIVFLAVPALQRNNRNTQRKNNVSVVLAAISDYVANKGNGSIPGVWDSTDKEFQVLLSDLDGSGIEPKITVYLATDINYNNNNNAAVGASRSVATMHIRGNAKCNTAGDDVGGSNPSSRSIAVVYSLETSGNVSHVCQES